MAENEKEEEKEPKVATPEDILKASGNDELKFGLLIGLIKVGQVSNKDVVDTVLYLVSTIKEKTSLFALVITEIGGGSSFFLKNQIK